MKIMEMLHVTSRKEWRRWLKKNYNKKQEIWLVYYKRHTGKLRIPYDDAVEEAICFGWIDSTVKKLDGDRFIQKFTPRKSGSIWAKSNILRARKMIAAGRMTTTGLKLFNEIRTGKAKRAPVRAEISAPPDLLKALAQNAKARDHFNNFAPSHRKMYIWWINEAKKPETRRRRIKKVVAMAVKNQKPGMM